MPAWFICSRNYEHVLQAIQKKLHILAIQPLLYLSSIFSTVSPLKISDITYCHREESQNIWLCNFTSHGARSHHLF